MNDEAQKPSQIDVALLSEILREFVPYRVMLAHQKNQIADLLADRLPHNSWYYDAWVVANAYQLLSEKSDVGSIERGLLDLLYGEIPDENLQQAHE